MAFPKRPKSGNMYEFTKDMHPKLGSKAYIPEVVEEVASLVGMGHIDMAHIQELCDDDPEFGMVAMTYAMAIQETENQKTLHSDTTNATGRGIGLHWLQSFRFRGKPLKPRQMFFVAHYVKTLNISESCRVAGYAKPRAKDILKEPKMKAAVQAAMAHRLVRLERNAEDVVDALFEAISFDPSEVFKFNGSSVVYNDMDDIPLAARRMIKNVTQIKSPNQQVQLRVEFYDKAPFMQLLAKHLGMLTEKVEIDVNHTVSERITRARERALARREQFKDIQGEYQIEKTKDESTS